MATTRKHCLLKIIILVIILTTSEAKGKDEPTLAQIQNWAQKIDILLQHKSPIFVVIKELFQLYDKPALNNTQEYVLINSTELVNNMSKSLSEMMIKKMDALWKLVKEAEIAAANYQWKKNLSKENVNYVNSKDIKDLNVTYVERFSNKVNSNSSGVHIPVEIYDGDIEILNGLNWSAALDEQFKKNYNNDTDILWQYFGSHTGFMRSFPAASWPRSGVDLYDVRRQSWYTQGSSSPKDMLILIDKSGSTHGQSLQLMKNAVKSILDTLGENDFVNIIAFAENPEFVSKCFNHTIFVQANFRNKKLLARDVDNITANNQADFSKAIKFAFEKFQEFQNGTVESIRIGADCNKVIMLLTDGGTDNAENIFRQYNWPNKTVRVFTYAVGPTPNPVNAIRWMACANRGFFSQIPAMGAIRAKVQEYVEILTRPLALGNVENVQWSSSHLNTFYDASSNASSNDMAYTKNLSETMQMYGGQHILWEGTLDPREYIPVLSRPQVIQNKKSYEWGNIYVDYMGLGMMTTVTLPVYNRSLGSSNQTILGVMGIDVTTSKLEAMTPYDKIGPNGYSFAINPNGYVVFHPNLPSGMSVKDPPNIDILELEIDEDNPDLCTLRTNMIEGESGFLKTRTLFLSEDQRYVTYDDAIYSYTNISNTSFRLAIAIPYYQKKWPQFKFEFKSVNFSSLISNNLTAFVAPWNYHKNNITNTSITELQSQLDQDQNPDNWNLNLLYHLYWDANAITDILNIIKYLMNLNVSDTNLRKDYFNLNYSMKEFFNDEDANEIYVTEFLNDGEANKTCWGNEKPIFIMTNGGLTVVFPKSSSNYFDESHDPRNSAIYKRTQHYNGCIFMAEYIEGPRPNTSEPHIIMSCAITKSENNDVVDKPAVVGGWFKHDEIISTVRDATKSDTVLNCDGDDSLLCYLVDDGGFLVASNAENALENIGRFFGEVEPSIFNKLLGDIYNRAVQYDFQAKCPPETAKTSAGLKSFMIPTISMFFDVLNVGWWTSKVSWAFTSFNFFSWLFSPTVEVFAQEEDDKDENCVKMIQQYYFKNGSKPEAIERTLECQNYTRNFTAVKVVNSSLLFIVAYPEDDLKHCPDMLTPTYQTPRRLTMKEEEDIICQMAQNPRTRNRQYQCYHQDPREDVSQCRCTSLRATIFSVFAALLVVACQRMAEAIR